MAEERRRKRSYEEDEGEEKRPNTFVVGYASLATIVLAFFICMCSMGTIQEEKVMKGLLSVWSSFGVLGGYKYPMGKKKPPLMKGINPELMRALRQFLSKELPEKSFYVGLTGRGYLVGLQSDILFAPGSYRLKEDARKILLKVLPVISSYSGKVRVEGYTDANPPKGGFTRNWDLGMKRALAVVRFFVEKGVDPRKFEVASYGAGKPLFPNDTPEHMAKNRRVWILFKRGGEFSKLGRRGINIRGFFFKVREILR